MRSAPQPSGLLPRAWLWPTLLGVLLGLLPHLTQRVVHGTWLFLGDNDDVYYAMIARAPFWHGWSLRDPFANAREAIGVSYAWGLFVPMAKIAAIFGDTPGAFLIGWRVLGGALLGWGLWFLLATIFDRGGARLRKLAGPWGLAGLASVLACTLMLDPGFDFASLPLQRLVETAFHLARHDVPRGNPGWYGQIRIVSPVCALGLLFALLALLSRPRLTKSAALVAGLLLGVLFNLHFFFWTAPVALLVALLVLQVLPRPVRRWLGVRQPRELLLLTLAIGVTLGLPQLLSDFSHFGDPVIKEALERTPRGLALAWHNPRRWLYLTGPRLWLDCVLMSFAAVRVRALRVSAMLVLISFVLANSALVTGLEFENYKWLHALQTVSYLCLWVWGITELARFASSRHVDSLLRVARASLAIVLGIALVVALVWIPRESLITPEAGARTRKLEELSDLQPIMARFSSSDSLVAPNGAQPALLFTAAGVLYEAPHTNASFISDRELIERHVLSAWVLGEDRPSLYLQSSLLPAVAGEKRARWGHLQADYEIAWSSVNIGALDKFRVRYAVTLCAAPPASETGLWSEVGRSGRWCAWQRAPTRA
jgi:hypothetical protein